MRTEQSTRLAAGDRLPVLELPAAPDGRPFDLRAPSRDARVLLLLPRPHENWTAYVDRLAGSAGEIGHWAARILILLDGGLDGAREFHTLLPSNVTVLADADREAFRRIGARPPYARLVIADRYGQVYDVTDANRPEQLPDPAAIESWVRYLAMQCPECGVIDEPGYGEWTQA